MGGRWMGECTSTGHKNSRKILVFTTTCKSSLPWLCDAARLATQSCGQSISPAGRTRREKIPLLLSVHCRDTDICCYM